MVRNGHREHDVLWEYSIEKATRYFEECMERDSWDFYNTAIRDFNVHLATSTPVSKKHASEQRKGWEKYLNFINPQTIRDKVKKKKNPMKGLFDMALIPIVEEPKKESDTK